MPSSDKRPEELAEELLQFINQDMTRKKWANISMALKYEMGEDVAHQLFRKLFYRYLEKHTSRFF